MDAKNIVTEKRLFGLLGGDANTAFLKSGLLSLQGQQPETVSLKRPMFERREIALL